MVHRRRIPSRPHRYPQHQHYFPTRPLRNRRLNPARSLLLLYSVHCPPIPCPLTLIIILTIYHSRFNTGAISFQSYKSWRASQTPSSLCPLTPTPITSVPSSIDSHITTNGTTGRPPLQPQITSQPESQLEHPASFDEIMALIESGQPVPGIKEIPNTVLVGQGTEASRSRRQKPWERLMEGQENTAGLFATPAAP